MPIDKRISYIYHDTVDTLPWWKGYTEDFDSAVTPVADKMAEEVDKRTVGKDEDFIKFITIEDL